MAAGLGAGQLRLPRPRGVRPPDRRAALRAGADSRLPQRRARLRARAAPTPLVDLAVDPGDPTHWVGTSEQGIFVSTDEGRTWRRRDPTPRVRLAWAAPGELYRIDPGGPVHASADGGATWQERGNAGGESQALTVDARKTLFAASLDGTVQRSEDGGRSWRVIVEGG